jgi:hypothetical protein
MSGYRTGGWFGMVLIGAADERVAQILQEIYTRLGAGNDTQKRWAGINLPRTDLAT